jgi:chorismate mutase
MKTVSALEAKYRALNEEIRSYPTPIARCDEQLAKLLEDRAKLLRELEAARRKPASRATSRRA